MDYNFLPKDSVVSMAQLTKYCANAEYIGRYPINDNSHAYVYTKLNKTFAVIWSTGDKYEYEVENGAKGGKSFRRCHLADRQQNINRFGTRIYFRYIE